MSSSKARFQSSTMKSKVSSIGSGSKKVGNTSGFAGMTGQATNASSMKPSQIQVIYQGKIATPQSLLRKSGTEASSSSASSQKNKKKVPPKALGIGQTIDENATEHTDKEKLVSQQSMASRLSRRSDLGDSRISMHNASKLGNLGRGKSTIKEELSTVMLTETPTNIIMFLPSFIIPNDTRDVVHVEERNARYEKLVEAHNNPDGFANRLTQTKNYPHKNQNEMAAPNALRDFGSQAVAYEINDATSIGTNENLDVERMATIGVGTDTHDLIDSSSLSEGVKKFVHDTVGAALVTPGCLLDVSNVSKPLGPSEASGKAKADGRSRGAKSTLGASKSGFLNASGEDQAMSSGAAVGRRGPNESNTSGSNTDVLGQAASGSKTNMSGSNYGVSESNGGAGNGSGGAAGGPGADGVNVFTEEDSRQILMEAETNRILSSTTLLKRLQLVERAIQQNANHRPQLDYRDLPDITPVQLLSPERAKVIESGDQLFGGSTLGGKSALGGLNKTFNTGNPFGKEPSSIKLGMGGVSGANTTTDASQGNKLEFKEKEKVKRLFRYSNKSLVQGRSVTAMAWNTANSDLLAVGYGQLENFVDPYKPGEALDEERTGGLVLFWSLRNPDYPEKILRTPFPVTALDFSKLSPMTLAVGLINGDVNVYDVKREGAHVDIPIESSAKIQGCHSDPVWQLKWIIKGVERLETLVSISTDGRVLEWNLKKGLVMSSLMQLKKTGMSEGWISNSAAGLCFDFHPQDSSTYITGTEDGSLHRCSVSYNEQYLESYKGHNGPVYRIKFSPRWPNMFLTCSADWSLSLYHIKIKSPILDMKASGTTYPVNDICWCPGNSTMFASVTVDAKLQIWDLSVSSIDPIIVVNTARKKKKPKKNAKKNNSVTNVSHLTPGSRSKGGGDTHSLGAGGTASLGPDGYESDDSLTLKDSNEIWIESDDEDQDLDGDDVSKVDEQDPLLLGKPGSALGTTRFTDRFDGPNKEEVQLPPTDRLIKNLTSIKDKEKTLTTVLFGDKTPTIAVGDNNGNVTIYRIFEPQTITHLGPLQQYEKFKTAILKQSDPTTVSLLESAEKDEEVRAM